MASVGYQAQGRLSWLGIGICGNIPFFVLQIDPSRDSGAHATAEAFRFLVEQVVDYAIFILDPLGHIVTWNAGAQRIKGYTASEIVGQHISKFYRPEDVASVQNKLDVAAREGRFADEGWRVRKDGTLFWASVVITALRDPEGGLVGFAKVTRDMSEQRQASEILRQSEERFRLLVESVKDYAIFMLDPEGKIATWNIGAERLKGYSAEEIVGKHFSRFYPEADVRAGKCELELEGAVREGRFEDEGWRVRKDGSRFWANVVITALRDRRGTLVGFAKVTRDLTERRLREQERVHLAERTAARDAAERLVGLLTHLQALAGALAAARTPEEVAHILVTRGAASLHASTALFVVAKEDKRLELLAQHGAPESLVRAFATLDVDARVPAATAYRTGTPLWVESPEDYSREAADFSPSVPLAGSIAALPLVLQGVVLAVMVLRFDEPRQFAPDERALMETFVVQAAQALDLAQVYARELASRHHVEALGAIALALSSALATEDVVRVVVEQGISAARADTCILYALDESSGTLELLAERGCNPSIVERLRRITAESGNSVYAAVAKRESVWVESEADYASVAPELATAQVEGKRAHAFWSVPLVVEDRAVGLLGMGFHEPRRFSRDERDFVETFTRQCAEALLRARRLESERAAKEVWERLRASLSTTLRSIGDAVIATDPMGVITLMNPVAESLTGWPEAEAQGRGLTEVFRIINEHTRAPVESPVGRVLERGTVVGLANHTVLVARDGREIPIDDSGAPIRQGGVSDIEGVVLVFRDVSEKKRAESRRAFLEEATVALVESLDSKPRWARSPAWRCHGSPIGAPSISWKRATHCPSAYRLHTSTPPRSTSPRSSMPSTRRRQTQRRVCRTCSEPGGPNSTPRFPTRCSLRAAWTSSIFASPARCSFARRWWCRSWLEGGPSARSPSYSPNRDESIPRTIFGSPRTSRTGPPSRSTTRSSSCPSNAPGRARTSQTERRTSSWPWSVTSFALPSTPSWVGRR